MLWNDKDDFDPSNRRNESKNETSESRGDEIFINKPDENPLLKEKNNDNLANQINKEFLSHQLGEEELSHQHDEIAFINKTDEKIISRQTDEDQSSIHDHTNESILNIESLKHKYPSLNQNQIMSFETLLSSPSQGSFNKENSLIHSFTNIILLDETGNSFQILNSSIHSLFCYHQISHNIFLLIY
jgi:hypothetical protein